MTETRAASDPESSAYLDFELQIGLGQGLDYPVSVLSSPAGQPQDIMHFPFDELQLDSRLKDVQIALLLPAEARRRASTAEEQGIQRFGRELFDALMVGEVRSAYDISCRQAEAQGKGLRVVLRVQSPALASLPWEFLYDPREGEYLCLMSDRPVVRYIETAQPVQPLTVTPPLRILGMIASPAGLPPLNVEQEKLRLAKATEKLQAQGLVELVWLEGQTWRDLQRAMRGGPWHIFHFVGHGGFDPVRDEGLIVMTDDTGQPHYLTATEVSRLLADHKPLRLVLLNACEGARGGSQDIFSSTASILVRRGIPAVVAMQYPVTDRAAVEFAHSFYESLADGLPADAAVSEARKAVSFAVSGTVEWGTPVLFMRASDGRIFDITRTPERANPALTLPPTAAPARIVPEVVQIGVPVAEPLAQTVPQLATAGETPAPAPQPVTPAWPRWLWPAIGGVIGLIAIAVAVLIATNDGNGELTPTAAPTAMPELALGIGSTMVSEKDSMALVYVPAGEFLMGSTDDDSDANSDEKPQHRVTLDAYWIDRTEVTNDQYQKCVAAGTCEASWCSDAGPGNAPVVCVSWQDAANYCAWAGRRLPTEAEWEKAARGNDGRKYPWGNQGVAGDLLNFCDSNCDYDWKDSAVNDGYAESAPVGSYPAGASPYGALDMAGSVWEWMADWYDESYYSSAPAQNPQGPDSGQFRVLRSGSWSDVEPNNRTASRLKYVPDEGDDNLGFRCARSD